MLWQGTHLSLALEVWGPIKGRHAIVQAALTYTSELGDLRLRVITAVRGRGWVERRVGEGASSVGFCEFGWGRVRCCGLG